MDKRANDKLIRSPRDNGGEQDAQNIFTQELERTGRRARHKKKWKEEVERDLQVLGMRRWRELVAERIKWKEIIRQAKAPSRL